jgi:hypothetical protein
MKKRNLIGLLVFVGVALLAVPALANSFGCYQVPPPAPAYGSNDIKVDLQQGATGVVGVVTDVSCTTGVKTIKTDEISGSAKVAGGYNPVCAGGVVIGSGSFNLAKTCTFTVESFRDTVNATTLQNQAAMNQTTIVAATLCGIPASYTATQNQVYTQSAYCVKLPGGGYASSAYTGFQATSVVGGVAPH